MAGSTVLSILILKIRRLTSSTLMIAAIRNRPDRLHATVALFTWLNVRGGTTRRTDLSVVARRFLDENSGLPHRCNNRIDVQTIQLPHSISVVTFSVCRSRLVLDAYIDAERFKISKRAGCDARQQLTNSIVAKTI